MSLLLLLAFGTQYQNQQGQINQLVYEKENVITKAYPIDNTAIIYPKGTPVRFTAAGTVAVCTPTDRPFGYVRVANRLNDTDFDYDGYVTVAELGVSEHVIGYAKSAAVLTGALVTSLGTFVNDPNFSDYRTAVSTNYAIGMCVSGGADGSQIEIALFAQPFLIP